MTRVLVVGPDRVIDEELLEALSAADMSVERISDAASALASMDRDRPDGVLCPVELPQWSGTRLLRHVETEFEDVVTFLLVRDDLEALKAAQQYDITPLFAADTDWSAIVDVVQDRVFEIEVDDNKEIHRHLSIATAEVLLESMEALNRASNYRNSPNLLKETAIASARDMVEQSVCSNLVSVPAYGLVWVSHFYPDTEELEPQAAAGLDLGQLRERNISEFSDVGAIVQDGELGVRLGENFVEALVPLQNGESIYGAVHVQKQGGGFTAFEQDQLNQLGQTVGRFISALERRHEIAGQVSTVEGAEETTAVGVAADETSTAGVPGETPPDAVEDETSSAGVADETTTTEGSDVQFTDEGPELAEDADSEDLPESFEQSVGLDSIEDDEVAKEEDDDADATDTDSVASETESPTGKADSEDGDSMTPLVAYSDTIAHELRNHVNVAQAFLDLGRNDGEDENFDRVESALERINRLTDEAAAVAQGGVNADQMTSGKLAEDARIAWERVDADDGSLAVEDDLSIVADHDLLVLLLENLFRNAADHVGPDVDVRVGCLAGDRTGFYVEDDGPGIPESDRERLFGWGVSGGDSDGGIGLAIVKQIVDNHGWTITIADGSDGGARFEIADVEVSE